MSVDTR